MKNTIKSFITLCAAFLAFAACNVALEEPQPQEAKTHTVTFVAGNPDTKTAYSVDGTTVVYSWKETDADTDKFHVFENGIEGTVTSATIQNDKMVIEASFNSEAPVGEASYTGYFNSGIQATQSAIGNDYDQDSDVLVAKAASATGNVVNFVYKRLGAICEVNLKGLAQGTKLKSVTVEALDTGVFLAGDIDTDEIAGDSRTIRINCTNAIESGVAPIRFVSIPVEDANLRFIVETANSDGTDAATYVKSLSRPISFTQGDVKAFNVSGFAEVTTTATFSINGEASSVKVPEGFAIAFPEVEDVAGYSFMGWTSAAISGEQESAPADLMSSAVMGNGSVTYYAVFARESGFPERTATLTAEGLATGTYKTGNKTDSEGNTWNYFASIYNQSGTYCFGLNSDDNNYNIASPVFEGPVNTISLKAYNGSSSADRKVFICSSNATARPDSGDIAEITVAKSEKFSVTYTADFAEGVYNQFYIYVKAALGFSEINVTYGGVTYSNYCTAIDPRTPVILSWSTGSASVRIGDANEFPTLTTTPADLAGIEYSSSNTDAATIDDSGNITLVAAGTTIISASFAGNDDYRAADPAEYTLNVGAAAVTSNVYFSINGNLSDATPVQQDNDIVFPEVPSFNGYQFIGWATDAISGTSDTAPTTVTSATMGTGDITYYAVFAKAHVMTQTYGWESDSHEGWTISSDIARTQGTTTNPANSGSYYGALNKDASVEYDSKVNVTSFSYYCVRKTNNTNTSIAIQISEDGFNWSNAKSNSWSDFKDDGKTYTKIEKTWDGSKQYYVRLNIVTAANRMLDDVSITYQELSGYCTDVEVISLTGISVSGTPAEFWKGDTFNHNGMTVTAHYSDNSEEVITDAEFSTPDMTTAGEKNVTVSYYGQNASYQIEVKTIANTAETAYTTAEAKALIDAGKDLSTEVYVRGTVSKVDSYNSTYHSITYWLDNDSFEVFGGLNIEGADAFASEDDIAAGAEVIVFGNIKKYSSTYEFSQNNRLVSYHVPASLSSIAIKTAPSKTAYSSGECFDPAGLVITKTLSDNTTIDVPYSGNESGFTFTPSLSTALSSANTSVTITYGGKSTSQDITVNAVTRTITLTQTDGGTISATVGGQPLTGALEVGTVVTLTAEAGSGYSFTGWTVTGATPADSSASTTTITVGTENIEVSAAFEEDGGGNKTYSMTIDSSTKSGTNNVHWGNATTSSLTHDGVTWSTAVTGTTSFTSSTTYCQIGSKNNPATNITLSTSAFAGKTIEAVKVTCFCMTNVGPTLTVTAGSTTMINAVALTKTNSTEIVSQSGITAVMGNSDNLTISFNSSANAAICISKIEVSYK